MKISKEAESRSFYKVSHPLSLTMPHMRNGRKVQYFRVKKKNAGS